MTAKVFISGLGGSEGEEEEEGEDERQINVEEKEQGKERECTVRLHEREIPEKEEEDGRRGGSGSYSWGEGEEGRVPVLSCRAPTSPQGELFRPYCLKDPLEYKYGLHSLQVTTLWTIHPDNQRTQHLITYKHPH